jgi:hypothetical protein
MLAAVMEYSGKDCQVVLEASRQRPVGRCPASPKALAGWSQITFC